MNIIKRILFAIALASPCLALAQSKPALGLKDFGSWSYLYGEPGINATGSHVFYQVADEKLNKRTLHLQALQNGTEKFYEGAIGASFSQDGQMLFIEMPDNLLIVQTLANGKEERITDATGFKLISINGNEWMHYRIADDKTVIRELTTGKEQIFTAKGVQISAAGKYAVLINPSSVVLQDIRTGRKLEAWKGAGQATNVQFDKAEKLIVFELEENQKKTFWMYNIGGTPASRILDDATANAPDNYTLGGIEKVVAAGRTLLFTFDYVAPPAMEKKVKAAVNVYSFVDTIPYSEQKRAGIDMRGRRKALLNMDTRKVFLVETDHEKIDVLNTFDGAYTAIEPSFLSMRRSDSNYIAIVSTVTGEKKELGGLVLGARRCPGSADGKYLLVKEPGKLKHIYSYEVSTGKLHNLTAPMPIPDADREFRNDMVHRRFTILCWIKNTYTFLLNDNYDIWKIDVTGKNAPVNLTNGYGRKNRILFSISVAQIRHDEQLSNNTRKLLLASYNYNTCENDFYSLDLRKPADPVRLSQGGYLQEDVDIANGHLRGGAYTRKAAKADLYIVSRKNASESENIYTTTDFKTFKRISHIEPEKKFNWLTSELVYYTSQPDGRPLKGVLYKPENFDPSKKYPVIFLFYLTMSHDLHRYHVPELSGAVIDIPYYVSNGYLVFTPDVDVEWYGRAAEISLNSVMGAADKLVQRSYVDSARMGLNGHSWGGFECNYIVTHSSRFAAALSGAGAADNIGAYGLPTHGGMINWNMGYDNARGTLTEKLDVFVRNSPKIQADNVTTPLLIMHNRKDQAVPFTHSEGFFNYLWNLGKRVWMLEYDDEDHVINDEENQIDFTIRATQFFDHYLKGKPAPVWMTHGLPYSDKGYRDGLELDNVVKTPVKAQ